MTGWLFDPHLLQEVGGAVDLLHDPQQVPHVGVDRAGADGVEEEVGGDGVVRPVEEQTHELAPAVEGRGAGVAAGSVHRGQEVHGHVAETLGQYPQWVPQILLGRPGTAMRRAIVSASASSQKQRPVARRISRLDSRRIAPPPSEITASWQVFPAPDTAIPAVWTDPTGSERVKLTPEKPVLQWANDPRAMLGKMLDAVNSVLETRDKGALRSEQMRGL